MNKEFIEILNNMKVNETFNFNVVKLPNGQFQFYLVECSEEPGIMLKLEEILTLLKQQQNIKPKIQIKPLSIPTKKYTNEGFLD